MKRNGFVLVSVLWVVVILSAIGVVTLASVRDGARLTGNRVHLTRAEWARAACAEILQARFATEPAIQSLDTVELGRGAWCLARFDDPERRLNLNRASPEQLRLLFQTDSLVASFQDWIDGDSLARNGGAERPWYRERRLPGPRNSPLVSVDELRLVRGFDSAMVDRIRPLTDVIGDGRWAGGGPAATESRSLLIAELAGGVRGTRLTARGRIAFRVAGRRLATLWRELP